MKPIDYRNATFADLQERLHGMRLAALNAWRAFGPGTTREVAQRSGIDLLTLRPRTTELVQLGMVAVVDASRITHHEGIYRALADAELRTTFTARQQAARGTPTQAQLALA